MSEALRWCVAACGVLVFAGCAKREPPSGGPPDLTPPRLLSSSPDSGGAGVALQFRMSLTFSEAMEPRSTQESVQFAPPVPVKRRHWSGRTLTLELEEPLKPDHVYTMFVGGTARDRHGNNMSSGATIAFSTGAVFPPGHIGGLLNARGFSSEGTYLWCYDATRTGVPDSTARDFDALGVVDDDDHFQINGLRVPGRYRLWAFADLNLNRSFDPDRDVLAAVDTTFELTESHPRADSIMLRLVNPRAPAVLNGTVVDSLRDSLGVTRVLAVSDRDSTLIGLADIDREGNFELSLRAGSWTLRAFQDQDRNRDWQPVREPASAPLHLDLEPASVVPGLKLLLRGAGAGPQGRGTGGER